MKKLLTLTLLVLFACGTAYAADDKMAPARQDVAAGQDEDVPDGSGRQEAERHDAQGVS